MADAGETGDCAWLTHFFGWAAARAQAGAGVGERGCHAVEDADAVEQRAERSDPGVFGCELRLLDRSVDGVVADEARAWVGLCELDQGVPGATADVGLPGAGFEPLVCSVDRDPGVYVRIPLGHPAQRGRFPGSAHASGDIQRRSRTGRAAGRLP